MTATSSPATNEQALRKKVYNKLLRFGYYWTLAFIVTLVLGWKFVVVFWYAAVDASLQFLRDIGLTTGYFTNLVVPITIFIDIAIVLALVYFIPCNIALKVIRKRIQQKSSPPRTAR